MILEAHVLIIFCHIFVAEHFDVDVLINVVKTCRVSVKSVAELLVIFLVHQWLEFGQLICPNVIIEREADDFLVETEEVFVEVLVPFFDAPRSRVNRCTI